MSRLIRFSMLCWLVVGLLAVGGTRVSASSDELDQQQTAINGAVDAGSGAGQSLAQVLTVGVGGAIDRVSLNGGDPGSDLTVQLYAVDGSGNPTGSALATTTVPEASMTGSWFDADFSSPVPVSQGEKLAIVIPPPYLLAYDAGTPNPYAGGEALASQSGTWVPYAPSGSAADLTFQTWVLPATTVSVPINVGWNLVDVALAGTGLNAADVVASSMMASGGLPAGSVRVLATYSQGRFQLYVPGYTPPYPLVAGEGILILSAASGSWTQSGTPYGSGVSINLVPGWNLVAAPYPAGGLTGGALDNELDSSSQCGLQEAATVNSVHLAGQSDSFQVAPTQGVWLLCTTAYTWTPA